jgi:hypothetical protein
MKTHNFTVLSTNIISPSGLIYVDENGNEVELEERESRWCGFGSVPVYKRSGSRRKYFIYRGKWFSVPPGKCVKSAVLKLQAYDRASIPT